jgi:hypothetical protein
MTSPQRPSLDKFARRVLVVVGVVVLALTLWRITDALLLLFGAVLVAVLLRTGGEPLARHSGPPEMWAIGLRSTPT